MVWLQSPPWGRWALASLMVLGGLWLELRPGTTVEHPFATVEISRGDPIGSENTELRAVPGGLLQPLPAGAVASRTIAEGHPVLVADIEERGALPQGWWVVSLEVPAMGRPGDRVRVVVVDTGLVAEGVIVSVPTLDSMGGTPGAVALPSDQAAAVAAAALQARVAVMISTG
jgi:hypothetical protein